MSESPYQPGQAAERRTTWGSYDAYQAALWLALSNAYQARANGFEATRLPAPGSYIDPARYAAWKETLRERYAFEANRDRENSRALTPEDFVEHDLQCLYLDLLAAESLKGENPC